MAKWKVVKGDVKKWLVQSTTSPFITIATCFDKSAAKKMCFALNNPKKTSKSRDS